jgi:hypothetical protein
MPVSVDVCSLEAVVSTVSLDTGITVEEISESTTLQPDTIITDHVDGIVTSTDAIVTTSLPEIIEVSSETADTTTSDDQSSIDNVVSTKSPDEDSEMVTTQTLTTDDGQKQDTSTETISEEDEVDIDVTTEGIDTSPAEDTETASEDAENVIEPDTMIRCLFNGTFYNDTEDITSDDVCEYCQCVNGIKVCAERICPPKPTNYKNCQTVEVDGSCCPTYECDEMTTARSEEQETISTSRQPNLIGVTDILPGQSNETTFIDSSEDES